MKAGLGRVGLWIWIYKQEVGSKLLLTDCQLWPALIQKV